MCGIELGDAWSAREGMGGRRDNVAQRGMLQREPDARRYLLCRLHVVTGSREGDMRSDAASRFDDIGRKAMTSAADVVPDHDWRNDLAVAAQLRGWPFSRHEAHEAPS